MVEKFRPTPAQEGFLIEAQKAPVCVLTHDFSEELRLFDRESSISLSDPEFAIRVQTAIRHAFSHTHILDGEEIPGQEIGAEDLKNTSRMELIKRGLGPVLILSFYGNPRTALDFAYPEVLEEAKQQNQLADIQKVPIEDRGPRVIFQKEGNAEVFGGLYEKHYDQVRRHIYYRVGSNDDADDLTAQVFLNAWRAMPRYQDMGRPFPVWLLSIAHNLVVDHYRDHKRQTSISIEDVIIPTGDIDDPVKLTEIKLDLEQVRIAIGMLKKRDQKQLIILRFIDGLEYPDIAAIMGKSEGAVRILNHRALVELRSLIENINGGEKKTIVKRFTSEELRQSFGYKDLAMLTGFSVEYLRNRINLAERKGELRIKKERERNNRIFWGEDLRRVAEFLNLRLDFLGKD